MKRTAAKRQQLAASDANRPETSSQPSSQPSSGTSPAKPKRSVTITLAGKQYRLRSDASEESLQQMAGYVDQSLQKIRERTDTVDSLDTALLAALSLAREVLFLRGQGGESGQGKNKGSSNHSGLDELSGDISESRLRGLIEQVESALPAAESGRP